MKVMETKLLPRYDLNEVVSKSTIETRESEVPEKLNVDVGKFRINMGSNYDIFSNEWCDLVFEGKNQAYGAYAHRKNSTRRHFQDLIFACLLIIFAATGPSLLRQILPKKIEKELRVRTISEINLEKPKENNILKELPPPPPPLARNTIKFTPPVIKPDELVNEEDEPKMQREVVEEKAAISTVNFNKGTDDVTAPHSCN